MKPRSKLTLLAFALIHVLGVLGCDGGGSDVDIATVTVKEPGDAILATDADAETPSPETP